ncbi:hypothetical protein GCM10023238_14790 [Streptomyces heliomycini]
MRLLPWGVAFVLSVALLPTTLQVLTADYGLNGGIASVLAVAQAAPLLLAVVRPLPAWCVVFAADVAGALALLTVDFEERLLWPFPPMEIVGYLGLCLALGLRERRRTLLLVWLATAGANTGLGFVAPHGTSAMEVLLTLLSGVALLLAAALRERYEAQRRLTEQETISEAERGRRTLLEERARIARELHDVVAPPHVRHHGAGGHRGVPSRRAAAGRAGGVHVHRGDPRASRSARCGGSSAYCATRRRAASSRPSRV